MILVYSRELSALPGALVREHWQPVEKEAGMDSSSRFDPMQLGKVQTDQQPAPACSWRDVWLAMLPFLVILFVDALPKILVESGLFTWEAPATQVVTIVLVVLLGAAYLGCLYLAWRQKWPDWSAVWFSLFILPVMALGGWLLRLIVGEEDGQSTLLYVLLPLSLAVLLYTVTRLDRLRGLLTSLPALYFLWLPNMEFVPDTIEVAIKVPSTALVCLAIIYLLRRKDWRSGLYIVLGMNLLVGAMYSYAGIYHGGTLPFVAPGPNIMELLRSLIPQYLATSAILLGPFFAREIRQAGRAGKRYGRGGYYLALAGLLLVILAMLLAIMIGTTPDEYRPVYITTAGLSAGILIGLSAYLIGIIVVFLEARQAGGVPFWAQRILLTLLPLAIPLTFVLPFITWKWPLTELYGIPLLWEWPHALSLSLGLAWLALSLWVVTREPQPGLPDVHAAGVLSTP
jgi:hypothetical protein